MEVGRRRVYDGEQHRDRNEVVSLCHKRQPDQPDQRQPGGGQLHQPASGERQIGDVDDQEAK